MRLTYNSSCSNTACVSGIPNGFKTIIDADGRIHREPIYGKVKTQIQWSDKDHRVWDEQIAKI